MHLCKYLSSERPFYVIFSMFQYILVQGLTIQLTFIVIILLSVSPALACAGLCHHAWTQLLAQHTPGAGPVQHAESES